MAHHRFTKTEITLLQLIISIRGTVSPDVAQYLSALIRKFLNIKYIVKSSDEFLMYNKNLILSNEHELVLLKLESLFTNVPVARAVDLLIQCAYCHPTLPPSQFSRKDLRKLLKIRTQETRV